jgi:hypothetical protein
MNAHLDYTEDDALKRILRHHDVPVTSALLNSISQLINWVRETERVKASFTPHDHGPTPMISLLGAMGIYGKEYIDKVPVDG